MADARANFATSLVATAPSPATSGTSLVVEAATGARFPAKPFNVVLCPADELPTPDNAEIVRVTDVTTDTLTIDRAEEGTSAKSVAVGWRVYAGITVKALDDLQADIDGKADASHDHVAAGVTDFHTAVRTNRLDEMTAPNAEVGMNSQQLGGLITPVDDDHAARKKYVDDQDVILAASIASGLSGKTNLNVMDTKGDLFAATGNDAVDNLPAGANDTLLMAASGETMGLKYDKVKIGNVDSTLKPSGSAAAGDEALRAIGSTASTAAAGNHGHSAVRSLPIWMRFLSGTGVPAERATSLIPYNTMADAAFHIASGTVAIPDDATAGVALKLRIFVTSTATGVVMWECKYQLVAGGGGTSSAPTTAAGSPSSSITANQATKTDITLGNAVAGSMLSVRLLRLGTSGSDTLAANAELMSFDLVYTATV